MAEPEKDTFPYAIRIDRARFSALLVLVVLVLLANHVILQVLHYQWHLGHWVLRDLFDVDEEENFPTWFSAAVLLLCASLLYAIAAKKTRELDRFSRHWLFLSMAFVVMSVDEVAGIHEALNTVTDAPWTIPGAMIVTLAALFYVRFLTHLPVRTRVAFVLAGAMFVGGAVGVEHATDWYLESHDFDSLGYNLLTAVEEGMEMFGIALFIDALLGYMEAGKAAQVELVVEQE